MVRSGCSAEPAADDSRMTSAQGAENGRGSSGQMVWALAQLLRVPNLFTAISDSLAGYLLAQGSAWTVRAEELACLLAASMCFYGGGVVLNDLADQERDRLHRPERPLPSGRISPRLAGGLGFGLLVLAWLLTAILGILAETIWPVVLGTGLAAAIFAYDFGLKSTRLGFVVMGTCRSLNMLLGISLGEMVYGQGLQMAMLWAALSLGVYVAGITLFASREEKDPTARELLRGLGVMALALVMLAMLPAFLGQQASVARHWPHWIVLVLIVGGILGIRAIQAVQWPTPCSVQQVVKQAILWIIVWDATLCFAFAGAEAAMLVVALLIPAGMLGLWIRLT